MTNLHDLHDAHVIAFEHYEEFEKGDGCYHTGDDGVYSDAAEFEAAFKLRQRRQRRIHYLSVNPGSLTPIVFCVGESLFWVNPNGLGLYTPSRCVLDADEFSVRRYLAEPNPSVRRIREYIRYRLPAILSAVQ